MNKIIAFSLLFSLVVKPLLAFDVKSIATLPEYYYEIEKFIKKTNLKRSEVLVCFDLDGVSVVDGKVIPLEDKTTWVYQKLLNKEYPVLMLTARNDGIKREPFGVLKQSDKLDEDELDQFFSLEKVTKLDPLELSLFKQSREFLKCMSYFLNKNLLGDLNPSFINIKNILEVKSGFLNPQYGYLADSVFYAGQEKGMMLHQLLPSLDDHGKNKYKALFMVDDQRDYLDTFNREDLKNYFGQENIHLFHFVPRVIINIEDSESSTELEESPIVNDKKRKLSSLDN